MVLALDREISDRFRFQVLVLLILGATLCVVSAERVTGFMYEGEGDFEFGPVQDRTLLAEHREVNSSYDWDHPPYRRKIIGVQHYLKRCVLQEPFKALNGYDAKVYSTSMNITRRVLIQSPCLGSDSLGNLLGHYFESIFCARHIGAHYMAVAKVWEPRTLDEASPFVGALPDIVEVRSHRSSSSGSDGIVAHSSRSQRRLSPSPSVSSPGRGAHRRVAAPDKSAKSAKCPCPGGCHERAASLWTKNTASIRTIVHTALERHLTSMAVSETVLQPTDLLSNNTKPGDTLPLIPSVAIHYRCGDNFVGPYGFLPFSVVRAHIEKHFSSHSKKNGAQGPGSRAQVGPQTIYVLAEHRGRKTGGKKQMLAQKCDHVLRALHNDLTRAYPDSRVVVRRGDDLYVDMARLSRAQLTICSVSTFCLWPAIANRNVAYFPRSALIVGGRSDIDLGFRWIGQPELVKGVRYASGGPEKLVATLSQ